MTKVLFCHGAQDRLQAAAAWLLHTGEKQVIVYTPDGRMAERLDQLLWTTPPTGFLAHCHANSPLAPDTPILIAQNLENLHHDDNLLNLSDELPPEFSRFRNLVEIVNNNETVRLSARERVKFYRDRGYDIEYRDLQKEPL